MRELTDPLLTIPALAVAIGVATAALFAAARRCRARQTLHHFPPWAMLIYGVVSMLAFGWFGVSPENSPGIFLWVALIVAPQTLAMTSWLMFEWSDEALEISMAVAFLVQIVPAAFATLFLSCLAENNCP